MPYSSNGLGVVCEGGELAGAASCMSPTYCTNCRVHEVYAGLVGFAEATRQLLTSRSIPSVVFCGL